MHTLVISIILYACESTTLAAELQKRAYLFKIRRYRRLLSILYKDKVTLIPYLSAYKTGFSLSRMTSNNKISPMKIYYNTSFTIPKKSQSSRSVL